MVKQALVDDTIAIFIVKCNKDMYGFLNSSEVKTGNNNVHIVMNLMMNSISTSALEGRFDIRKRKYLSERFIKSPRITACHCVSDHLFISYAPQDATTLPLIQDAFLRAYGWVMDWFGCRSHISLDLWVAPEAVDLQFMTCLPCDEGFFCAPGDLNGTKIILFVSPLSCKKNADMDYLSGLLAHEITHYVVVDISDATPYTMKRKENRDVPMWLEEGLCQLIQSELCVSLQQKFAEQIEATTNWLNPDDLWNDLSSCVNVQTAYLQAYRDTKTLMKRMCKTEVFRLLRRNRTHRVNWNGLLAK